MGILVVDCVVARKMKKIVCHLVGWIVESIFKV